MPPGSVYSKQFSVNSDRTTKTVHCSLITILPQGQLERGAFAVQEDERFEAFGLHTDVT